MTKDGDRKNRQDLTISVQLGNEYITFLVKKTAHESVTPLT